jgi:hypothetical protein
MSLNSNRRGLGDSVIWSVIPRPQARESQRPVACPCKTTDGGPGKSQADVPPIDLSDDAEFPGIMSGRGFGGVSRISPFF